LIANISGTDQAVDRWKTALATTIFVTFEENNSVNFGQLTKKTKSTFDNHTNLFNVKVITLTLNRFVWLSRYVFVQNIIKLSLAVPELSC